MISDKARSFMKETWIHSSKKFQRQLQQLTQPVHQALGTHAFGYISINAQHELINLHSHIPWLEHCIDKQYYLQDPCMVAPNNIQGGFAFYFTHEEPEFCEGLLKESIEVYDMAHEIIFIDHHKDSFEVYSLAASKANHQIYNLILNQPRLIKDCFNHLIEGLKFVKLLAAEHRVPFAPLKPNYHTKPGIITASQN